MALDQSSLASDRRAPPSAETAETAALHARPLVPMFDVEEPTANPRRSRAGRWIAVCVLLAVVLIGGTIYWLTRHAASAGGGTGRAGQAGNRAVSVGAIAARRGDLPVYVDALGTVTPLNTVTVRTRVDGQIDHIAFVEGQVVQKDDLLAQIDPRPFQVQLEQAEAQLARDQATLKNAQVELDRDRNAGTAIAKQQVDTQQSVVDQAEAATHIDEAQIDNARLQLTYCRVTAPIGGVIGLRDVDQGNIVHASDANGLAVITQVQPITVVFSVSEDQLPAVLKATARDPHPGVDAYDRDLTASIATGTLLALDNQVDPTTGMVKIKAQFANDPSTLYPNQFVNARLRVDTVSDAVIVPAAAVQRGPDDSTFVYVVKPDETVDVRAVTLGPSEADETVIQSGLSAGEIVVTDGVDKLQPGSNVAVGKLGEATTHPTTHATSRPTTTPILTPMNTPRQPSPNGSSPGTSRRRR